MGIPFFSYDDVLDVVFYSVLFLDRIFRVQGSRVWSHRGRPPLGVRQPHPVSDMVMKDGGGGVAAGNLARVRRIHLSESRGVGVCSMILAYVNHECLEKWIDQRLCFFQIKSEAQ